MNILNLLIHLRDDLKSWVSLNFETLNKKIDKKSQARFSRDYHDLYNAPQITEDNKKELAIADEQGNVIFKLDKDGAHTTNLTLNGEEAASQKYVKEAIENIDFPETDLTDYATKEDVKQAVDNIEFPETDLTGYATEEFVKGEVAGLVNSAPEALNTIGELAVAMKEHEDAYDALLETVGKKATSEQLQNLEKNFNEGAVSENEEYCIADKNGSVAFKVNKDGVTETANLKTKELTVNEKTLEKHLEDALQPYATSESVKKAIKEIDFPETDLTGYATEKFVKEEISKIDFPETDLTDYATEEYVRNKIAEAQLEGEEIDLSGYATKEDIKKFITKVPDSYIEEEELQSALDEVTKELSEHPTSEDEEFQIADDKGLVAFKVDKEGATHVAVLKIGQEAEEAATKKYVDEAIGKIDFPETDLTGYATEEFVNEAIEKIEFPETDLTDYATKKNVTEAVREHADKKDIHITQAERESWFDGEYGSLKNAPSISEDEEDNYTIADKNGLVAFKVDSEGKTHTAALAINGEDATTKKYVDSAIKQAVDSIDIPEVDLSNHATKQYVDEAIDNIEFPVIDLTGYATEQFVKDEVAGLVNSAPEALNTIGELAAAMEEKGDAIEALEKIAGSKAAQADLDKTNQEVAGVKELVGETSVKEQIEEALDNFETFSGDYEDLVNAPDISEDGSGDMAVADKDGNVAFKVDSEGRTHVTSLAVGGENLESILEGKATRDEITLTSLGLTYGKEDLTPGVSPLPTGHFYFVYE